MAENLESKTEEDFDAPKLVVRAANGEDIDEVVSHKDVFRDIRTERNGNEFMCNAQIAARSLVNQRASIDEFVRGYEPISKMNFDGCFSIKVGCGVSSSIPRFSSLDSSI